MLSVHEELELKRCLKIAIKMLQRTAPSSYSAERALGYMEGMRFAALEEVMGAYDMISEQNEEEEDDF